MQRRLLILLLILAWPQASAAQIATPEGVTLSPFPVLQAPSSFPSFADGGGGVWSVFLGDQPGSALYAQHILDDGAFAEPCTPAGWRLTGDATQINGISADSDGQGGAVVTWFGVTPTDSLSPFIALRYLHLLAAGRIATGMRDTGVVVSNIASAAMVVGDGAGGAYVVWEELKNAENPDIFAQHYSASGARLWTPVGSPSGVPVCAVVGIQRLRALHADGQGGAYVVWADQRVANTTPLYVARLDPSGVVGAPWPANGIRVTPITSGIRIVSSSVSAAGGLWLAWRDLSGGSAVNGQHVAANAAFRWVSTGALLATVTPLHGDFVAGANGQAFFTWGGSDIRCAKLDSTGVRLWSAEPAGRVMVAAPWGSFEVHAASDGAWGQRIAWTFDNAGQNDVRVIDVDATGAPRPGEDPTGTVFAGTAANESAVEWFSSAHGEPSLAWLEDGVLKIRRLLLAGVGVDAWDRRGVALASPYPNPVRGSRFTLRFAAPAGAGRAEIFDTSGRRVAERAIWSTGGEQSLRWEPAAKLAPGVYALRLTVAGQTASRRVVSLE